MKLHLPYLKPDASRSQAIQSPVPYTVYFPVEPVIWCDGNNRYLSVVGFPCLEQHSRDSRLAIILSAYVNHHLLDNRATN